jgi:hypothetical protein
MGEVVSDLLLGDPHEPRELAGGVRALAEAVEERLRTVTERSVGGRSRPGALSRGRATSGTRTPAAPRGRRARRPRYTPEEFTVMADTNPFVRRAVASGRMIYEA